MTQPMLLMASTPATDPPVHGDRLRRLVTAIYTDRYGLAPDTSPYSGQWRQLLPEPRPGSSDLGSRDEAELS